MKIKLLMCIILLAFSTTVLALPKDDIVWITNKGDDFLIVVPALGIQENHPTPDAAMDSVFSFVNIDAKIATLRATVVGIEGEIARLEASKSRYEDIAAAEPVLREVLSFLITGHPHFPQYGPAKEVAVTAIGDKLYPVTSWGSAHPGYDGPDDFIRIVGYFD